MQVLRMSFKMSKAYRASADIQFGRGHHAGTHLPPCPPLPSRQTHPSWGPARRRAGGGRPRTPSAATAFLSLATHATLEVQGLILEGTVAAGPRYTSTAGTGQWRIVGLSSHRTTATTHALRLVSAAHSTHEVKRVILKGATAAGPVHPTTPSALHRLNTCLCECLLSVAKDT